MTSICSWHTNVLGSELPLILHSITYNKSILDGYVTQLSIGKLTE